MGDYPGIQSNSCGIRKFAPQEVALRIVRGENATLGEFPWMAMVHSLIMTGDSYLDHYCGAALINERFVVTAANCLLFPGYVGHRHKGKPIYL